MSQYQVTASQASSLEAYKDLSIALFSLCAASYLVKFGYKRAMLVGLALVASICIATPLVQSFFMTKFLFVVIGISFVLIKVGTYATVSQVTNNEKEHASLMSIIEGIFMLGWLSGYFLFGYFMSLEQDGRFTWLDTYWVLAALSIVSFVALGFTHMHEPYHSNAHAHGKRWWELLSLSKIPFIQVFIVCIFLYVFIEQGIATWLPSFNHHSLHLPQDLAVKTTAILAGASAVGRLVAGYLLKNTNAIKLLAFCLLGASSIIAALPSLASLPWTVHLFAHDIPAIALFIPMIGFFLAPIYPTLCSMVLSSCPQFRQGALTALIIIFSALGGTLGSRLTGIIFGQMDGLTAMTATCVPILILLMALYPFKRLRKPGVFQC